MQDAPVRKKKKHKWPLWIVLCAAAALIAFSLLTAGKRAEQAMTEEIAQTRDITTYYSFSGHLTPVTDHIQTAKASLKVKELYVSEGDRVLEGEALLRATDGTRVYAARTGTVETLYPEVDDTLQPGSQIARIVDYEQLEVSVDVDEYDIDAVEVGKQGTVYLNALDRSVPGTVSEIARSATTEGGVSYFDVTLQIAAEPDVRSGMSVEVNLLNQQAPGVVSVSLNSLSYDEYNKPFVYKKDADGKLTAVYVQTGVSDGKNIEIVTGVSAGERVYSRVDDMARFYAMQAEMMGGRK